MTTSTKSAWWRAVLGEYPTGVALITSVDAMGPVGMIVGTFTAVSQNPPLVGFLADMSSTTFPKIAKSRRFCASILGTVHEGLCRQFVAKDPDRFESGNFVIGGSGIPRVADAIAWFDSAIWQTVSFGDHHLVVGEVQDFGVGGADGGYPLLFRRAGYGAFTVPTEEVDAVALGQQLRVAELAEPTIARLAQATGLHVMISTVVRDRVLVLREHPGSAGGDTTSVGNGFPFAAPVAPVFVAWSAPQQQHAWIEGARHLIGSVDRAVLHDLLSSVRRRGFAVSTDRNLHDSFRSLVQGPDPTLASYSQFWAAAATSNTTDIDDAASTSDHVTSMQAPIFDARGHVMLVIAVDQFENNRVGIDRTTAWILDAASRITHLGGGHPPASYPRNLQSLW